MKALILVAVLLVVRPAQSAVWKTSATWTEATDREFAAFIEKNYVTDVFTNPSSPLFGLETDCADALYIARAWFAATHSLPFVIANPRKAQGFISQEMSTWDHLPEEKRLRAFLEYVADATSTLSLETDTYPVKISREFFQPGVLYLDPGNHVEMVRSLPENGLMEFIASTTPKRVRPLFVHRNPVHAPLSLRGGFRQWKKPQDYSRDVRVISGYSLEQFQLAGWSPGAFRDRARISRWLVAIREKLDLRPALFEERREAIVSSLYSLMESRVEGVKSSWQLIYDRKGQCLKGSELEDHSTEARDRRLRENFAQLYDLQHEHFLKTGEGRGDLFDAKEVLEKYVVSYWPGRGADLWVLLQRMKQGLFSANANHSPAVRWGERASSGNDCR